MADKESGFLLTVIDLWKSIGAAVTATIITGALLVLLGYLGDRAGLIAFVECEIVDGRNVCTRIFPDRVQEAEPISPAFDFAAMLSELKDWQTLLAAVFGIVGLIAAHILGTRHQRTRDEEICTAEAKAIATALKVEVQYLSSGAEFYAAQIRKKWPNLETKAEILREAWETDNIIGKAVVYQSYADRLGLLSPAAISGVVGFHLMLGEFDKAGQIGVLSEFAIKNLEDAVKITPNVLSELDDIINA